MSIELPVLYHEGRTGKMYQWKVWTEGNVICTEYGTVDGEKSETRKAVKGKNIGKSNETTPEEQADKEAQAMHIHKLERKYSKTAEKAKEVVFLPMLAHDYIKKYMKRGKSLEYPVIVQPKLDGVRCMAFWHEGKLCLMSRGGKQWLVEHIREEVAEFLPEGYVLDGELYVHGLSLQQITHLVKDDEDPDHGKLEFRVFDGFFMDNLDMPWSERGIELSNLMTSRVPKKVNQVGTWQIKSEEELFEKLKKYENQGFEGIIIRTLQGKYNLGHRSPDLLKLKNFIDAEFEIIGHGEATGNDKGTVVWECTTDEGKPFTVRPMGSREYRKELFERAEEHYGKLLTVKFQAWTDDNIPQFPVGVSFRLEEDI